MELLIVAAVCVISGAVQNIAGFGAGIIMMLVLPHFYGIVGAASLNQAICTGMVAIVAYRYRKWIDWKILLLPTVCYLIMSLCVISLVGSIDLNALSVVFGICLILLSVYFLFVQKNIKLRPTPQSAVLCGLLAGAFSGLFSLGAPIAALYFLSITDSRETYLGNLQLLFTITNIAGLGMRAARGYYTAGMLPATAVGFAMLLIGQWLGSHVSGRLNTSQFNRAVYLLVGFSGLVTLLKQL